MARSVPATSTRAPEARRRASGSGGLRVSFAVSLVVIAALLHYVRDHDLRPFGWYRIALAAAVAVAVLRA
jgi:undecaprenyl pyrophosphate phosphatase UppP